MIFLRVFVPFALGFILSYILRVVNAVIAPLLIADIGLNAGDLGLLTAVNFFALAAFQVPLGVLLDRYGPRKTEATLLLIAAAGTALFAVAVSLPMLLAARALMGLGTSACLMAAFTAFALWLPREKLPQVNSYQMVAGALGALAGTTPIELLQVEIGWRGVFWVLTGVTLVLAAMVYFVVPRREHPAAGTQTWVDAFGGVRDVFSRPLFWRVTPACVMNQANFIGIQSLWLGPWFQDVMGLERPAMADALFWVAAAMVASYFFLAWTTAFFARRGIGAIPVSMGGMTIFIALQLLIVFEWIPPSIIGWMAWAFAGAFGVASYAGLTQKFPTALAGRVVTGINVMAFFGAFAVQWAIGAIIDLWPTLPGGGFDPVAYQWAFGFFTMLHIAAMIWYVVFTRERVA